jgi:hypothetical protein
MSSTSLRVRAGKRAGCEAIPILQGASVKTCPSTYEVEYTTEKVCSFRHFKAGELLRQHVSPLVVLTKQFLDYEV